MKTTVIYHSADYDGIFCREIAKKFLPDAELIGWNFGDKPLDDKRLGTEKIWVLDLPVDEPFGLKLKDGWIHKGTEQIQPLDRWDSSNVTWIDHHGSSIASHPTSIPGYRIDGVAACRLAWQWFQFNPENFPRFDKQAFINRDVVEPFAVRLAGEYDIWDKRDDRAELFQHGLRSQELTNKVWQELLDPKNVIGFASRVQQLLGQGKAIQYAKNKENESIIKAAGFNLLFEGLEFLVCNHARYNSFLFTAGLTPEHDACLGFAWRNGKWNISLYHAPGKEHHDLSKIAVKYGGGGHKGACGFTLDKLPFIS